MIAAQSNTFHKAVILLLCFVDLWQPTATQVGLRTLPMTASFNRSSSHGLLNRWGDPLTPNSRYGDPSIELELAAILRDIAYGETDDTSSTTTTSTSSPTTTTSTTSTTTTMISIPHWSSPKHPKTAVNSFGDSNDFSSFSSASPFPNSPVWKDEWDNDRRSDVENEIAPRYDQYPEQPDDTSLDDYKPEMTDDFIPKSVDGDYKNFQSGVNSNEVTWMSSIGISWEIHVYTTAGFFSLIVLLSLYCLTRVYFSSQLLPRGYYMTVNLLVFLAAFFRCVYFFHDPYRAESLLPKSLSNILFHTGIPCIIAALSVLVLALLKAARLVIIPLNLQSPIFVAVVSGALVAGSLTVDVLSGLTKGQEMINGFKGVIQALISGWGAAICIGYIIIFFRIEKAAERQQNEIVRLTFTRFHSDSSPLPCRVPKTSLKLSARLTLFASIFGLLLSVLQIYGLIHSQMVINIPPVQPWVWFAYQTFCRILEVVMWSCICIASSLPVSLNKNDGMKNTVNEGQLLTVFSCKSCSRFCNICTCCIYKESPNDDMYSTICQSSHVARNFTTQNGGKLLPHNMITSTGLPPNHINTSLLAPDSANRALQKSSTLRPNASNARLLWNNGGNINTLGSCRPSSLIFTEEGLIKFCTDSPTSGAINIKQFNENTNSKVNFNSTQQQIYENSNRSIEDNYINGGALTPEEKRILEKKLQSEKLLNLIDSNQTVINYNDGTDHKLSYNNQNKISKDGYFCLQDHYRSASTDSPTSAKNSSEPHSLEDELYHSSAVSSTESSGHIYASIHQPLDQGLSTDNNEISASEKERILNNNENKEVRNLSTQRQYSFSNKSPSRNIQENNTLLNSYQYNSAINRDNQNQPNYYEDNNAPWEQFNKNASDLEYQYYSSETTDTPQKILICKNYVDPNLLNYASNKNNEGDGCDIHLNSSSAFSPSQKKRFLSKAKPSNFEDVRYFPLNREDESSLKYNGDKLRSCGQRPAFKGKHSNVATSDYRPVLKSDDLA